MFHWTKHHLQSSPLTLQTSRESQSNFFEKFKDPQYISKSSAFKLVYSSKKVSNRSFSEEDHTLENESNTSLSGDRKRGNYRKYTESEKENAVKMIESGKDVREVADLFNIPRRNLLRWKKNGCERKQGGGRPTNKDLEAVLHLKISQGQIKSQREVREVAMQVSKDSKFKASKGWYSKFKRRYRLNNPLKQVGQKGQQQENLK